MSTKTKTMKSNSKETNKNEEHSKFVIKFVDTVFVLGILFLLLLTMYAAYRVISNSEHTSTLYYSFIIFGLLSSALLGLGLWKLPNELKLNISILLITGAISVFVLEASLQYYSKISKQSILEKMGEQAGVPYDTRTKMELLENLKDSGIDVYPNFYPNMLLELNGLSTPNGKIFPLGGIPNVTSVGFNESGYYSVYETDEHGFNNPKGLYEINKVDIMLIGDSFTEGNSVHPDENISAVLRESGFNVINIGKGGNGPLIELASLKEYAEPLKPKIVLWTYYVNDSENVLIEMQSPLLQNYLNDDEFSQNLFSRQEDIRSSIVDYVQGEWDKERWVNHRVFKILKLYDLRLILNLMPANKPEAFLPMPITKTNQNIFKDILQKSKQIVSGGGMKMYFIYLPSFDRYSTGVEHINREFVLDAVNKLGIPIIDIHNEVFVSHKDPLSLFPFRISNHYNAKGYRLVAEAINKRLKSDGIIPLN